MDEGPASRLNCTSAPSTPRRRGFDPTGTWGSRRRPRRVFRDVLRAAAATPRARSCSRRTGLLGCGAGAGAGSRAKLGARAQVVDVPPVHVQGGARVERTTSTSTPGTARTSGGATRSGPCSWCTTRRRTSGHICWASWSSRSSRSPRPPAGVTRTSPRSPSRGRSARTTRARRWSRGRSSFVGSRAIPRKRFAGSPNAPNDSLRRAESLRAARARCARWLRRCLTARITGSYHPHRRRRQKLLERLRTARRFVSEAAAESVERGWRKNRRAALVAVSCVDQLGNARVDARFGVGGLRRGVRLAQSFGGSPVRKPRDGPCTCSIGRDRVFVLLDGVPHLGVRRRARERHRVARRLRRHRRLIVASFYPVVFYSFYCVPLVRGTYLTVMSLFGVVTLCVTLAEKVPSPQVHSVCRSRFVLRPKAASGRFRFCTRRGSCGIRNPPRSR